MKKIFTLVMLLSAVIPAITQNTVTKKISDYHPLIEENKRWTVAHSISIYFPFYHWYSYAYKFDGDSIINNLTYQKLYQTADENRTNWNFCGLLREDDNHKVYMRKNDGQDGILYDFSLELGDTVWFTYHQPNVYAVVTAIDMTDTIDGIYGDVRRRITLTYDVDIVEQWIEGIESTIGLLESGTGNYVGENIEMVCVLKDNNKIYSADGQNGSCWLTYTGIDDEKENKHLVYPNPTMNYIYIDFGA